MSDDSLPELTFSQSIGLKSVPEQLKLGEISDTLRRRLHYAIIKDFEDDLQTGSMYAYLGARWKALARDICVLHFDVSAERFRGDPETIRTMILRNLEHMPYNDVFDFVQFIIRHANCAIQTRREVAQAFVDCRAAYRVVDARTIVAVGTKEQADAFVAALDNTQSATASGARQHLVDAGVALRSGDWPGCVRESIHAVESVAVRLAPGATTLGAALRVIDQNGHLHGSLRAAFDKLYGYSSDEDGVRHALVFDEAEAKVDEADALFMLGACASFVSYLLARAG